MVGLIRGKVAQELRGRVEQAGIGSLLKDEATVREARMYLRMYGQSACASYLKRKARESGLPDYEITEEEMRTVLAQ